MREDIPQALQGLCFFRQKIVNRSKTQESDEYELLLRKEKEGSFVFPEELFTEVIINRHSHKLYVNRIKEILQEVLAHNEGTYSLNLDYQELYYSETLEFLKKFKYKKRLKIELTERIPMIRDNPYHEVVPLEKIQQVANLGYDIVLDDFLSGVNSYETLFTVAPLISRVKISVLPFRRNLLPEDLKKIIFSIIESISSLEKEIVIEGVEEAELLEAFPESWRMQTYFYDVPHKV